MIDRAHRIGRLAALVLLVMFGCTGSAMPAPPSYIDITSLPFTQTVTSAAINAGTYGGIVNEAWLRLIVSTTTPMGLYTTTTGSTNPRMSLYASNGTTLHESITFKTGWWRYLPAATYYIRVLNRVGGSTPDDFIVHVEAGPFASLPLPAGAILINDDIRIDSGGPFAGEPFPATAWTADGTFLGFVPGIPAGETGDALPSGVMLVHSGTTGSGSALTLYDASQASLGAVAVTGVSVGTTYPSIANDGTQFYVLARPSLDIYTVSSAGAVAGPIVTALSGTINTIGVSHDGAVLYYTKTADPVIYRHDTATDTPLSNLFTLASIGYATPADIARTPNGHPGELLVLSDGSIVTTYRNTSPAVEGILHVSAAGALIHNYEYNPSTESRIDHIHYSAYGGSGAINVWMFGPAGDNVAHIGRYNLSTGTFAQSFDHMMFASGVVETIVDPSEVFGPSSSCFMITMGYVAPPPVVTDTIPTCCDTTTGPGDTGTNPDPVGPLPPWVASCTDGGVVDTVADLAEGEVW